MEIITTRSQDMERTLITWKEIRNRAANLKAIHGEGLRAYGAPRGGQALAALFVPVDTPKEADIIVDDLIDSGATRKRYFDLYPNIPFVAFFDKQKEVELKGKWLTFPWEIEDEKKDLETNMQRVIQSFDDGNREGLKETPKRYLKFLKEFLNPAPFNMTVFKEEEVKGMVVQSNIPFYSLCEHHLAPFYGVAHVAYIPNKDVGIVGLSKLARTVDKFARRFQNQERITIQVADYLQKHLQAHGVAVVIKAQHLCMAMRGICKHDVYTTTSEMKGAFADDLNARQEFLNLVQQGSK